MNCSSGTSPAKNKRAGTATLRAVALVAAGLIASGAAHAALTVTCPVNWDELPRLSGSDLDRPVFGVKVRDWKPEYLDEYVAKATECVRRSSDVDSIKQATYPEIRKQAEFARTKYFPMIQSEIARQSAAATTAKVKGEAQLSAVQTDSDGLPERIELTTRTKGSVTRDCWALKKASLGALTDEGYRQVGVFARLCARAGRLDETSAAEIERQAQMGPALFQAVDKLISQVEAAARGRRDERLVQALIALRADIGAQESKLRVQSVDDGSGRYARASSLLDQWEKEAKEAACDRIYTASGMPAKWQRNMLLLGPGEYMPMATVVCTAAGNGAHVRYLSGGLLSKEGFEVRSAKRTVQIFSEPQSVPGGDPAMKVMVPVQAQLFDKKVEINRGTLKALAVELGVALANQ